MESCPYRRGTPVVPGEVEWIIQRDAADLTSRSLQGMDATSASLRRAESEGHACRARRTTMDSPALPNGRDTRVPQISELETEQAECLQIGLN
jgi:hypothetical protein